MPQRIYCGGCDATLYDGLELESPHEIIERYHGSCPKCSKQLKFDPDKVKFDKFNEESPILPNYTPHKGTVPQAPAVNSQIADSSADAIQKTWHYKKNGDKVSWERLS